MDLRYDRQNDLHELGLLRSFRRLSLSLAAPGLLPERPVVGSFAILLSLITLLVLVGAACESNVSGTMPPAVPVLPTYATDEFTGNRACAGVGLTRLQISFKSGTPEGYVVDAGGKPLRGPLRLSWPPGYEFQRASSGLVIVSPDKTIVIADGEVLQDVSLCPMADGRQLIWDPGHLAKP